MIALFFSFGFVLSIQVPRLNSALGLLQIFFQKSLRALNSASVDIIRVCHVLCPDFLNCLMTICYECITCACINILVQGQLLRACHQCYWFNLTFREVCRLHDQMDLASDRDHSSGKCFISGEAGLHEGNFLEGKSP